MSFSVNEIGNHCLRPTPSCLTLNVCPTQLCVCFEEIGAKLKLKSYPNGAIDLPEAYKTSTRAVKCTIKTAFRQTERNISHIKIGQHQAIQY